MQESEPQRNQEKKARFKAEQEQERIDFESALELQKKFDEREEVLAKEVHDIDWSDPSVLRYHALQNRPFSVAKEKGSEKKTRRRRKKSLARKKGKETLSEESTKKQKLEDDAEKEELQVYLNIVPKEESLDVESLATKYLIVDWETQILANNQHYYQIKRANGSVKHYKICSAMLYDFDRKDVLELYRLVKDRFQTASPEVIHMMVEKKYPLSQDTLSKMLSKRLEVDHKSEMGYELIRQTKESIKDYDQQDVRRRQSEEFHSRHQDAQEDHAAMRAEIEVLRRERLAYEQESCKTRQALARSKAHNRALEACMTVLETQAYHYEWQRQDANDCATRHIMRTQALEARARLNTLEDTSSSTLIYIFVIS
ncbi:hypothetical protein Tco_1173834 [Tanacetum coccineum]